MIPNPPHRAKGGAPLLGARYAGEPGPFGFYAEDAEPDDVDGQGDEPTMSHVEQQVQERIAAARRKIAADKRRRAELAEARKAGLARRHAAKLRHLKDTERSDARLEESSNAED